MNLDRTFWLRTALSLIVALVVIVGNRRQRHTILQGIVASLKGLVFAIVLQAILFIVLKETGTDSFANAAWANIAYSAVAVLGTLFCSDPRYE